jgi:hypothetical protein
MVRGAGSRDREAAPPGLFAIGGVDASGKPLATIEFAPVDTRAGSLGPWSIVGTLPEARSGHTAFVHASSLYVCGGNMSGYVSPVASCWRAGVSP